MGDSNNGGYNSSGHNPSMPNFTPTTIAPGVTGDVEQRKVQTARASYTLTALDIANGFAIVPILWDSPFEDTNYTCEYGVHDLDDIVDLSYVTGDMHNKDVTGFNAIVYLAGSLPLVQGQKDVLNTRSPQSLSFVAPESTLYNIAGYVAGHGGGAGTDSWTVEVTYTDATGIGQQTAAISAPIVGNATGWINNFIGGGNIYALKGTTITVATVLTNNAFAYDFSVRITQVPNAGAAPQLGDQFVVNAVAIHD